MINEVTAAISQKLEEAFGSGHEFYMEKLEQGFQAPCFFICLLNGRQEQVRGNRYFREHSFDIHYFPQSAASPVQELQAVAVRLMMDLEYVNLDSGPIRGTKMNYEMQEEVLHFFIHYDFFVRKVPEEVPLMMELHQSQKVKEG
ncbi:MAG TPA: hypothetical protein PKA10_07805 [Selenomonadales bacterium]|nr:hypothetical protein [Selenomonadales bacterium]